MRFLEENGGQVDDLAARLGAVNTITVGGPTREPGPDTSKDLRESASAVPLLSGHNTDYPSCLHAICVGLKCRPAQLGGRTVTVLGAGGVARAVIAAVVDAGAKVTVFNRTEARAKNLADLFGCDYGSWDARLRADAELIVNCTSVGMWPEVAASPLPREALKRGTTVFDTIYNPRPTQLLRDAADQGCPTIDGLTMFCEQARRQFEIWTGVAPAAELLHAAAIQALTVLAR